MKHVFIINPAAGNGKKKDSVKKCIDDACREENIEYDVYYTKNPGDAVGFINSYSTNGEKTRFYSCGGDGTLNEVVNGIISRNDKGETCEAAMVPIGSGNDFPKAFEQNNCFENIRSQIKGSALPIDIILYSCDGKEECAAINEINLGFDCAVVERATKIRKRSVFTGSASYIAGIASSLIDMPHSELEIELNDDRKFSGNFLLSLIANGMFYGGGFKGSPFSSLDDGKLNLVLVKNTTRMKFISLVKKYKEGLAHTTEAGKKLITYLEFEKAKLSSASEISMCIDGEIKKVKEFTVRVLHNGINFIVPCKEI